jgi:hypothetical protein
MDHLKQIKLIDNIRQTLKFREHPAVICSRSRVTCEAILSEIWQREFRENPNGRMFQSLADGITKKKPELIPVGIQKLLGTIQHFGNYSSHAQANLEELEDSHAIMVEAALTRIANWFFVDYLCFQPAPDFQPTKQSEDAQSTSYRQLITSMLEDGVFELDEYENLVDVRKSLQLPKAVYKEIEKQVVLKKLGRPIESIREILKPGDLQTFKRKYENRAYEYPEWLNLAFTQLQNDTSLSADFIELLTYHLKPEQSKMIADFPPAIAFMGCWQGWYAQWNMKTFFDLFFIAKTDSTFLGISYEPVNPNWGWSLTGEDGMLMAALEGDISEEGIIQFKKKMLLEDSWEIQYTGVVLDDGQYFEGEWDIDSQSGSFNATKSKSLLPIHIYDTETNQPITRIKHLERRKDPTGTWFLRLAGKSTSFVLLHLFTNQTEVHANVVYFEENTSQYQYLTGTYDGFDRIVLETDPDTTKNDIFFSIRFTIDWSSNEINGTTKELIHKMRSLKGYRI